MLGVTAEAQFSNDPDGRMVIPLVSSEIFPRLASTNQFGHTRPVSAFSVSGHLLTHSTSRQEGPHRKFKTTGTMKFSLNSLPRGTHSEWQVQMDCDLESQSCVQLDNSGSRGASELTEKWISDIGSEPVEVCMVESIKHFHTNLEFGLFSDRKILCEAEIKIPLSWQPPPTRRRIAWPDCSATGWRQGNRRKRRRVEIFESFLVIGKVWRPSNVIRALSEVRCRLRKVNWLAGTRREDTGQLPCADSLAQCRIPYPGEVRQLVYCVCIEAVGHVAGGRATIGSRIEEVLVPGIDSVLVVGPGISTFSRKRL